ncbi:pantoate--beta-alanine ligase, partial [Streptomyces sp. NPDC057398]|uniref:pantoate--beta-alanine ligase n=1 Tax=Streptomyces sp. NPDC057398 TaxID=3346118 RepID=UPI003684ECAA
MTTTLLRTAGELHARVRTGRRAVVMTMGALHEGHATLVRTARELAGPDGEVVVTVFVNPLQFGAGEDLDRYPRTLDADVALAGRSGADVVFAPAVEEVYPGGEPQVRISAGPMGERLEGSSRPGHFDGMLTVVAKLLHLTRPDIALYGQKDAQQLALIRRMVRDLNFGVEIAGVPTVREEDGLALSSRNRYLSAPERRTALALSRALFAGRDRHAAQEALRARAREVPATRARAEALSALGESRAAAHAGGPDRRCGRPDPAQRGRRRAATGARHARLPGRGDGRGGARQRASYECARHGAVRPLVRGTEPRRLRT